MDASTYPRERLQDWDNVAAWTRTFLTVAGSIHIADYYTKPGYEDPNLVNYISVSRHAQLLQEAEAAVPRLAGSSSFVELQEQAAQRKLAVYSHYSTAIDKERAVMRASCARHAVAFLRSALHPRLHADVLHICEAYEMWQHIQTKAKQPTEPRDPSRFYDSYRKVVRLPMESIVAFTTRTEASIDAFLAQLAPVPRDTTGWDEAAYHGAIAASTSVFDQLRTVFLGHALCGQDDFKTWFDATPDCSCADIKAWAQCSSISPRTRTLAPRHAESVAPEPALELSLCTYCQKTCC
ncbi:hypothetical protein SDRG_16577 [Saprolegnia diclina VS20]|uniref:Uncharacterized protein n=1 Tax=Saprolegnia diclina (strain VS20) TaxID=1156394 RepID=T0PJK6_SAPDV|nr:hypothetical protein SDRG_16577 [Saprolegnia diclina VS20]EQC25559.1 hypothetical protein SDRG_16577 [Saprolegnia diclina VS20]|eukprot:XP_008621015.1 hypothetical protein SDRG_16577 [Saprolegnia diclina VS20]